MDLAGRKLGVYDVLGRLGAGGMGEVWLARDPRLEREVALKLLPRAVAGDPEQLGRFRREALALAAMNHPNIATIHGLETLDDGTMMLVMERVEGDTLASRLTAGALPLAEALHVGARIAEALEAAHERGVVHRDLKPSNVMVGARGRVKVLDFGLARAEQTPGATLTAILPPRPGTVPAPGNPAAPEHSSPTIAGPRSSSSLGSLGPVTQDGAISGTPGYMSPEQASGAPQDARTDVFSFGCVLYECLSGRRAFRADDAWETIQRTIHAQPDWTALPATVPQELRALVERCLAKPIEKRLPSVREARERLESLLGARSAAPEKTPNNLPRALASFVGRTTELASAESHLESTRLLTLTGVGGCGKTRLALEVASRRLARHPDGVWFADLARVADADRVIEVIAAAVGAHEESGRSLEDVLVEHLAPRRTLLVLDNCEHVLGAVGEIATRLLESAPNLVLLATSREGLGLPGETLQSVPSLALPPRGAATAGSLTSSEAVRLFVERAQAAQPGFVVDDDNAGAVAEICRRLDGIPLALELAAARVRVLSVDQIRERLDDRFRLLTGGSRTALPRHQTLRAALQWSWDQLGEPDRELLRTLAVFAGGWTFDAVAAVTPEDEDEFEVLDRLARLVDKSLVVVDRDARGSVRYRFLESVRQLALEQLDESGRGPELRRRHLAYFLELAERSEKLLLGPRQAEWFERLEHEQENLLAALATTANVDGGASMALRLAGSVWRFWSTKSHYELGRRVLIEALSRPGAEAPTAERARALVRAGGLAVYQADWTAAQPLIEESLAIYRTLGDDKGVARCLSGLAVVASYREDDDAAERTNRESIEIYRRLGEKRGTAIALHNLGYLSWCRGDHAAARTHLEEALGLLESIGDREATALTLAGLGEALFRLGDRAGAVRRLQASLTLARDIDARREACYALEGIADLAVPLGEPKLAAQLLAAARQFRRESGLPHVPREERERAAVESRLLEVLGEAELAAANDIGRGLGFEEAIRRALDWLGTQAV